MLLERENVAAIAGGGGDPIDVERLDCVDVQHADSESLHRDDVSCPNCLGKNCSGCKNHGVTAVAHLPCLAELHAARGKPSLALVDAQIRRPAARMKLARQGIGLPRV